MPRLSDVLRYPFSTLVSSSRPPRPGTPVFFAWRRLTDLNVAAYRATGGRIGGSLGGTPLLLLHHVGRRSGEPRVTPLSYLPDGDDLVVVASMGGTPKHPAWFVNLRAAPDTVVEVGRERRAVRARVVEGEERARRWPRLVEHFPSYAAYQARTKREIPVVVLSRRNNPPSDNRIDVH